MPESDATRKLYAAALKASDKVAAAQAELDAAVLARMADERTAQQNKTTDFRTGDDIFDPADLERIRRSTVTQGERFDALRREQAIEREAHQRWSRSKERDINQAIAAGTL